MNFYSTLNSSSTCLTYEPGLVEYVDFPPTEDPVFILGREYSTIYELEEIRADIQSKIWLTYRKNFPAIGGTGPTSDTGWGCMLRCGQMVMAQALMIRKLGRDWRWNSSVSDKEYLKILRMFQDKKNCAYSIHQIAQMGVSEGKSIGEWFGPNTVAQALRKLAVYDDQNNVIVHVAMDNTVIIDDIKQLCTQPTTASSHQEQKFPADSCRIRPSIAPLRGCNSVEGLSEKLSGWKPMLLFIPLRLGLTDINSIYFKGIKGTFRMKQSLGIIGGRPNHALYFIGYVGNELIFLDPHTTHPACDLEGELPNDETFHCSYSSRMDIGQLDPSVALCFYFGSEAEFDNWCNVAHKLLIGPEKQPLFEITKERPLHWPPLEVHQTPEMTSLEFTLVEQDRKYDTSDEEFELL